jgi:hypothetical protein
MWLARWRWNGRVERLVLVESRRTSASCCIFETLAGGFNGQSGTRFIVHSSIKTAASV